MICRSLNHHTMYTRLTLLDVGVVDKPALDETVVDGPLQDRTIVEEPVWFIEE